MNELVKRHTSLHARADALCTVVEFLGVWAKIQFRVCMIAKIILQDGGQRANLWFE
jgi:hypothetical protein